MYAYAPYDGRLCDRALRWRNTENKVMVLTGLTSAVCGALLTVARDEHAKRAWIVADLPDELSPVAREAVITAAKLLAARARRTLGADWAVDEPALFGNVLDLRERGSGH